MKPTKQMEAVGIGGIVAVVAMGLLDQLLPGTIDWTASVMGVPLGAGVVFLGVAIGGWIRGEGKK